MYFGYKEVDDVFSASAQIGTCISRETLEIKHLVK